MNTELKDVINNIIESSNFKNDKELLKIGRASCRERV